MRRWPRGRDERHRFSLRVEQRRESISPAKLKVGFSCLDDNQKAVVKAQTAGSHRAEDVGLALRSCFPSYTVRGKREHVYAVDDEEDFDTAESTVEALEDIEAFLAEGDISETEATTFEEEEVRDVLAVSWKDRRREIAATKASRNFTRVRELQQSFRKEVDELKKRTKCHKCGRVGHWARDWSPVIRESGFILRCLRLHHHDGED